MAITRIGTLLVLAEQVAHIAHMGQHDKSGDPYIEHPRRVAARAQEVSGAPLAPVVAWLHDVVEDSPLYEIDRLERLGFPAEVCEAVDALTHRPHETREDYYARVKANPLALAVKFCDIADNTDPARLAALDEPTRARLTKKYAKALAVLQA